MEGVDHVEDTVVLNLVDLALYGRDRMLTYSLGLTGMSLAWRVTGKSGMNRRLKAGIRAPSQFLGRTTL